MDIEDRAEKYARDHAPTRVDGEPLRPGLVVQWTELLRDAYLAGSAQTQADYVAHYGGYPAGARNLRGQFGRPSGALISHTRDGPGELAPAGAVV